MIYKVYVQDVPKMIDTMKISQAVGLECWEYGSGWSVMCPAIMGDESKREGKIVKAWWGDTGPRFDVEEGAQ